MKTRRRRALEEELPTRSVDRTASLGKVLARFWSTVFRRRLSRGRPEQQIRDEILHARDLSKKGGPERQLNYARRTATKAVSTVEPLR
jgi:hypothetical protein